jgi:hypothetical protein
MDKRTALTGFCAARCKYLHLKWIGRTRAIHKRLQKNARMGQVPTVLTALKHLLNAKNKPKNNGIHQKPKHNEHHLRHYEFKHIMA